MPRTWPGSWPPYCVALRRRQSSTPMRSSAPRSCARWSKSRVGSARSSCRRTGSPLRARDSIFACLNLSSRFRAFIHRGGVVPPPAIHRSDLTSRDRDALVGQMAPQPTVSAGQGASPLDRLLACHQWLALGVGVDPATMMSSRDLAILEALGARFICLNGSARNATTLSVSCDDPAFADWAERGAVKGVLVRPDRFIADRLDPGRDLSVLQPFAAALTAAAPRVAA